MYGKIKTIKKYEILVKNEQNVIIYQGIVDNAPEDIKEMNYKQIKFNENLLEVNV